MGKIFLSEFKQKLNKKQIKSSIMVPQTKIDFKDFTNRRNQTFISYLSKYLTDDRIRKGIVKINPYTVKFSLFSRSNNFGTHYIRSSDCGIELRISRSNDACGRHHVLADLYGPNSVRLP